MDVMLLGVTLVAASLIYEIIISANCADCIWT